MRSGDRRIVRLRDRMGRRSPVDSISEDLEVPDAFHRSKVRWYVGIAALLFVTHLLLPEAISHYQVEITIATTAAMFVMLHSLFQKVERRRHQIIALHRQIFRLKGEVMGEDAQLSRETAEFLIDSCRFGEAIDSLDRAIGMHERIGGPYMQMLVYPQWDEQLASELWDYARRGSLREALGSWRRAKEDYESVVHLTPYVDADAENDTWHPVGYALWRLEVLQETVEEELKEPEWIRPGKPPYSESPWWRYFWEPAWWYDWKPIIAGVLVGITLSVILGYVFGFDPSSVAYPSSAIAALITLWVVALRN